MSAPTPSPERRENEDDPNPAEHPCAGACRGCGAGVDEACYPPCRCDEGHDCAEAKRIIAGRPPELLGDFLAANPAVLDAVVGFVNRTRPPAPSPDPRSPEDGAGAPTPFETFQAGMFAGIMAERVAGRDPQDWTEDEVRREFRDWLEERAAATPANGATR